MKTYTVQRGDTLRGIALMFYGDASKFTIIADQNNINSPFTIFVGQSLEIPDLGGLGGGADGGLRNYHSAFAGGVRWRLTDQGVEIEGSGIERTPGNPVTITRIWEEFNNPINDWADFYNVPCALIIAIIATESSGNPRAIRFEPRYTSDSATPHQVSVGLMQTLISTARGTLNSNAIDREFLFVPSNSIKAGTSYIAEQRSRTALDPPKVACAYNAGGVYENQSSGNRWRMRQYPIGTSKHCDRFVKWFNDAVFVLKNTSRIVRLPYDNFYFA